MHSFNKFSEYELRIYYMSGTVHCNGDPQMNKTPSLIAVDWMSSPQVQRLKSNPPCDGIWRWGLWEVIRSWGWSLINEIIKETPASSLAPSAMWGCSEKIAVYESGSRLSSDTESAGILILNFSASIAAGLRESPGGEGDGGWLWLNLGT